MIRTADLVILLYHQIGKPKEFLLSEGDLGKAEQRIGAVREFERGPDQGGDLQGASL